MSALLIWALHRFLISKWENAKYSGFLSHVTTRWETMRNAMERLAQWKEGYACLITTGMDWGAGVTTVMLLFWSAGAVGVNTQRRIHKHSCSFFISYLLLMMDEERERKLIIYALSKLRRSCLHRRRVIALMSYLTFTTPLWHIKMVSPRLYCSNSPLIMLIMM